MDSERVQVTKWYSITEIVDIDTGEVITKSDYERRNLRIIKKTQKNEINGNTGVRKFTWECREHEQYRLSIGEHDES